MNIRNIKYIVFTAIFSMIASGCVKEKEDVKNDAFGFTVRVSEVSYNYARVTVKHNGPEDVTWYGFVTDDIQNSEGDVFYEKYIELIESGNLSGLKRETERSIYIDNLQEKKSYRYIAFGLKENGELYENAGLGFVDFKTTQNIYILKETQDWALTYEGRSENGKEEYVSVEAKKGGRFGWNYVSKEVIDSFNKEYPDGYEMWDNDIYMTTVDGIKMFILEQISMIQYYTSNGYDLKDLTYSNAENNEPFKLDRLSSGEYYLVAYGFEGDGQHTQTYSVQPISIKQEEATPEYNAWLGNYTFTGEVDKTLDNGEVEREERTYEIEIKPYDNNFLYRIHGWECGEDVKYDWEEDIMQLDKEKGEYLAFPAYFDEGRLEIKESPMTYITFDGATTLTLGIYGYAYMEAAKDEVPVIFDNYRMALAEPIKDGETSTQLIGQHGEYKESNQTTEWDYTKMGYIAWNTSTGAYQTINPPMRFPITITKTQGNSSELTPENPSQSHMTLFTTKKISTDFLRKDFSKLEKVKPEIYQRVY